MSNNRVKPNLANIVLQRDIPKDTEPNIVEAFDEIEVFEAIQKVKERCAGCRVNDGPDGLFLKD